MQYYATAHITKKLPSNTLYKTYGVKLIVVNNRIIKLRAPKAASAEIVMAKTISNQFIEIFSKPKEKNSKVAAAMIVGIDMSIDIFIALDLS